MRKRVNYIILVAIIALFITLPAYQMWTNQFDYFELELKGVTHKQEEPEFKMADWLSFTYQPKLHRYLLENYGFRSWFIKVYKQIMFSFFGEYKKGMVTYGKEGYLFEPWFISAYYGKTFIGDSLVIDKVQKLQAVIDKLDESNTKVMIVLNPGKATYYPEYIPDRLKSEKKRNNYEAYRDALIQYEIPFLDINEWFVQAKDTTRFPLFPKTGTHWSEYGASISFDSIVDFMQMQLGKPMGKVVYSNVHETEKINDSDIDIEELLNLIFPLDRGALGAVDVAYEMDSLSCKPSVVCISDSFYWLLHYLSARKKAFEKEQYWYYNREIYSEQYPSSMHSKDLDLSEVIDNTDVFMLMACPSTIEKFAWGFIDRAYDELVLGRKPVLTLEEENRLRERKIEFFRNTILNNEKWLQTVKEKAIKKNISVDSMLTLDAIWIYEHKKNK